MAAKRKKARFRVGGVVMCKHGCGRMKIRSRRFGRDFWFYQMTAFGEHVEHHLRPLTAREALAPSD